MNGDTASDPPSSPENEAREEAEWELITAHTLRGRGDLEGAATWFRRAVEHLMDAGDDDRALEVARLAAEMRTQPPPAPSTPAPVAVAPPPAPVPVVVEPVAEPVAAAPESLPSIIVTPQSEPPAAPSASTPAPAPVSTQPQPFQPAPSIRPAQAVNVPAPVPTQPPPPVVLAPAAPLPVIAPPPAASEAPPPPSVAPAAPSVAPAAPSVAPAAPSVAPAAPSVAPARRVLAYTPARAAEAEKLAVKLPALPVFGDMPVESLRAISRQVSVVRFAPGETMIAGDSIEGPMLVLIEGSARVSAAHQKHALDTASAGDMVGEIAAYHGGVQVNTVVAESAVSAVAFPPSLVRALAREYPSFRTTLEEVISDRAFASLPGNAGLLHALASAARESAYALFEPVKMHEGDALFSEGIPPSAVWLIAAGEVELYGGALPPHATERALAGTALCVGSVLSNEPCGVSARALHDVLVARIGAATFRGLAAQYPEIAAAAHDVGVAGRGIAC